MKIYEVRATEYNGEQEYSQSKLLAAGNIDQARRIARDYFRKWYDDGEEPETHNTDDPNKFEFVGGGIFLEIDCIAGTTIERWQQEHLELHSINALPKAKSGQEKLGTLVEVCEYVLNCLDVGGEQSRQFAEEIACLSGAITETRLRSTRYGSKSNSKTMTVASK